MPGADWIRKLYGYNEWANGRILASASGLSKEELGRERPGMQSLAYTLGHIAHAQRGWWCFWTGNEFTQFPEEGDGELVEMFSEWFRLSHAELREFAESVDDAALDKIYEDKDDDGRPITGADGRPVAFSLREMMLHVVNHGTQHRSEAATVLTTLDHSPGDLDFVDFVAANPGDHRS